MNNIIISRASETDSQEIYQLFSRVISDTFQKERIILSDPDEIKRQIEYQFRLFKKDLESGGKEEYFLIARLENKIVGTIAYGRVNNLIQKNMGEICPEVKAVYILPEYQKKGIGSLLFKEVLSRMKVMGINSFCLDCGYKSSQLFWKKILGEATIVLENYWSMGNHHMIWFRPLKA